MMREIVNGDCAKLREAVKELLDSMYGMGIDEETVAKATESPDCPMHIIELLSIIKKAKSALAAPPRNCDVGTAEEQEARYRATGEVYHILTVRNALTWAQMPYGKGGAK